MRQISLCLTHYNRSDIIGRAFEQVLYDERIAEICISDDHSGDDEYHNLLERFRRHPKVSIHRNYVNVGVGGNKAKAIEMASNAWCIIFDSDNTLDATYLDRLFEIPAWDRNTIYAPSFAKPHFDYRLFQGKTISAKNVAEFVGRGNFDCFLNTGNYFVNRASFLETYEHIQVKGADSIYILYLWFKAGKSVVAVPGLHYEHEVHAGSYFQSVAEESAPVCKRYEQLIARL
jgi:glycosyltransferase involved in cell wall biosynthesis